MEPSMPANVVTTLRSRPGPSLQRQRQDDRKTTLNQVKQLYLERRYKKCAALCEDTLKTNAFELHSLHKTYLHFFVAICYESLGQAAHNYSSNKLPFLNLAQQAFDSAKSTLPLPYLTDESGSYNSPATSPALTNFESSTCCDATQTSSFTPTFEFPAPAPFCSLRTLSSTASSHCSQDDTRPSPYSVPNFDDYSPRPPLQDISFWPVTDDFEHVGVKSNPELYKTFKLDTTELLSDLAPKPLYIKKSTIAHPPILQQPLPAIPPRGSLRTSQRQTALQVPPLVKHYEFLSTCLGTSLPLDSIHASARSSLHLARYNANLSSFRSQLSAHFTSVSNAINKTKILQQEHKAKQGKRLASYWMLKPAAESSGEVDRRAADKKERIDRLRQNGWNVNKETFGWKGEEYYRELRRRAEVELRG